MTPERKEEIRAYAEGAVEWVADGPDEPDEVILELLAALDEAEEELKAYRPCSAHGVSDSNRALAREVVEAARRQDESPWVSAELQEALKRYINGAGE